MGIPSGQLLLFFNVIAAIRDNTAASLKEQRETNRLLTAMLAELQSLDGRLFDVEEGLAADRRPGG